MLIRELLVCVTPPSAIPDNIQKMADALTGSEVSELISLDYVCKCRVVVQNINYMAACRLGKSENWHQIFTDGTIQRQIIFHNLVIGLMNDGCF